MLSSRILTAFCGRTKSQNEKRGQSADKKTKKDGARQLMNSHRAPSFCRCSFDCMLRSRTPFYRVRYQSLTHAGNTPGTPCKAGCFFLYCVIRARLFRIRSAVCFRVIRFLQSGQYFAWLELDAKAAPHTVQRRISSAFNSSAYNSLSRGSTAVRNHLQSSE